MASFIKKFKLNRAGVRALLQSPEMMAICRELAERVQENAGDGYELSEYTGRNRVNVRVKTATPEAMADNMAHNTLLRALGGGGE